MKESSGVNNEVPVRHTLACELEQLISHSEVFVSKNAVIYARYSSSNQREESIEGQLRECNAFAAKNGYTIIGEYIDRALTGKTDQRPEFQRMIRDSAKQRFEFVITYKIDRFARNRYDAATYKARLKKNNVTLVYSSEVIPEGPEGIILESVLEGCAEYYSANLAQNTKRGLKENALAGKYNGGGRTFGYDIDATKHYIINPDEALWVKQIYHLFNTGSPKGEILRELNNKCVMSPSGAKMNYNHISRILGNIKYTGVYTYDDVVIEDAIPAIITKKEYEIAQTRINQQALPIRRPHEGGFMFLLTTKLFCGSCGGTMCGDSGTSSTGTPHAYYSCINKKNKKVCKSKSVKKSLIEDLVIAATMEYVLHDDVIDEIANRVISYQNSSSEQTGINRLYARKNEVNKNIANIISAIEKGILSENVQERLTQLEKEAAELDAVIEYEKASVTKFEKEHIVFWISQFKDGDVEDPAFRMSLVDTFINSIFVFDGDKVVIAYNFSGDKNKVTLQRVKDNLATLDNPEKSSDYRILAPQVRLELTTLRLTAACSTN